MRREIPPELTQLLHASAPAEREVAWSALVAKHTRLLLHAAHAVSRNADAAMDAYAYVLEKLREDDLRRLRRFTTDGRGAFSTWLLVVARRLALDHVRQRYGRVSRAVKDVPASEEERTARRHLMDLTAQAVDLDIVVTDESTDAERAVREGELQTALGAALAALEARDQLLLKLRFDDGLSASEIATLLHFPSAFHVYRQLQRLFGQLRAYLARQGVTSPLP